MTDKERITEILKAYTKKNNISASSVILEEYAEELLANGVIVPPVKVGDKTFLLLEKTSGGYDIVESECVKIYENAFNRVYSMAIDCVEIGNTLEFHLNDFGESVFLTKEEAERELEKRGKENA